MFWHSLNVYSGSRYYLRWDRHSENAPVGRKIALRAKIKCIGEEQIRAAKQCSVIHRLLNVLVVLATLGTADGF
jgi:hypothetical protein